MSWRGIGRPALNTEQLDVLGQLCGVRIYITDNQNVNIVRTVKAIVTYTVSRGCLNNHQEIIATIEDLKRSQ